jgi:hypothetical protein
VSGPDRSHHNPTIWAEPESHHNNAPTQVTGSRYQARLIFAQKLMETAPFTLELGLGDANRKRRTEKWVRNMKFLLQIIIGSILGEGISVIIELLFGSKGSNVS